MTITETLNALAAVHSVVESAKESKLIGGLFSSFYVSKDGKTKEEMTEVLDWFLDGGEFTSYWKQDVPYGERKNSKKRVKNTFFLVKKSGVDMQLGHTSVRNYRGDWMEVGMERLVKSALCKEGEFSYHNHSFVEYVLSKGAVFKDLGEKK